MNKWQGLDTKSVAKSRAEHGSNKLPAGKRVSAWQLLLSQFMSPLILVLLLAGIFTLILGEYTDFGAICLVILINTSLGFFQEKKAQNALEALKKMIRPQVNVIRNGEESVITAEELVMGDVVRLKLGERVPADGVILEASGLAINEALLTGESAPIDKEAVSQPHEKMPPGDVKELNKLYMGTVVLSGLAVMVVTAIGENTVFGRIAGTLSTKDNSQTPLQKRLDKFSWQIAIFVLILAVGIFILGYFFADPAQYIHGASEGNLVIGNSEKIAGLLTLCISLAVSAIPEGLVISLTVVLTLSMQRLLKRKALVRKLVVAETLGSVSTICVDKTGTLTEGNMRVVKTDFTDDKVAYQALAAVTQNLNAVDIAISRWLQTQSDKTNVVKPLTKNDYHIADLPFNSKRKYAASVFKHTVYLVGAPELLLNEAKLAKHTKESWEYKIQTEGEKGHRIIGVGYIENHGLDIAPGTKIVGENLLSKVKADIIWLGIVIIEDPVRKDVKNAFLILNNAGIKIKVITGDQKTTAVNVMQEVGVPVLPNEILSGEELQSLDDEALQKRLGEVKLFYRTAPEQKLRIVELLKQNKEVVAMMGDGINDAPALKQADVGIAVENATEVSKETADIVLLDNNMFTIAAAVEEGRTIFENIKKIITYLLSNGTAEVFLIVNSIVFGLPLPMLALQILYINLIADGFPYISLAFERAERDLMKEKPRPVNAQMIDKEMISLIVIIGLVINAFLFGIYVLLLDSHGELDHIRSFIFLLMGVDSLLYVYSMRSLRHNLWDSNPFSNHYLNVSVIVGFVLLAAAFYVPLVSDALELTPLTFTEVMIAPALGLLKIALIEIIKSYFVKKA